MRGWCWLGAVVSLLWLVGLGGWLWMSSAGDRDEWYAIQLQRCYSSNDINREKLRLDNEQYDQKITDISREYYFCTERAKAIFDRQMDEIRFHIRNVMAVNAGMLVAIWLLVWIAIIVWRWIAAGSYQRL